MSISLPALMAAVIAASPLLTLAAAADPAAAPATAGAPAVSALEAGARYGQALGAVEICYGSKVTDKAKALQSAYTGAELEAFQTQAAKIFEAWRQVKACANQFDPNQCKIIMDKSCLGAEAEIGAAGTAIPGLVEFMKH
jgi:hypothetical protein